MASDKSGKVRELDILGEAGVETLDQYFDMLDKGFKKLVDDRKKQEKEVVDAQRREMKSLIDEYNRNEIQLKKAGIDNVEQYRFKLVQDYEKKRQKEQLKLIEEAQKSQYKIQTDNDKKRQAEERKAREQENKEKLDFYAKLEMAGVELTEAQKKDRDTARKENQTTGLEKAINQLGESLKKLDSGITKYSQYAAGINARLQGTSNNQNVFKELESTLTNVVGVNPYFRTETMLDNLQALVEAGIASNVEQRAFLQTAKDDIATTFDAANGALLRIIRLQQSDSTAARLGMEAYLTRFLNNLVENTEYLNQTFDSVQEALLEASSYMSTKESTEFEYVVQKWLGALTGVGLSESTATSIAQALGALGSGNIEALNGNNLQNLLVMAASRTNYNYADLLTSGLNAQSANALMQALVQYMVEIGGSGSNVVRSQFAQTFGLTYSDLKAAEQISSSIGTISSSMLDYAGMYGELGSQLNTIPQRLNMAAMIDTLWSNIEFGLSSNIAKNPALAAIWKVTGLIGENTQGINIPSVWTLPGGFDLEATVDNLVRLGVVGVSSLGMIGDLIGGLSSTLAPASMLTRLGITSGNTAISRGSGLGTKTGGLTQSTSLLARTVGTSAGEDVSQGAIAGASDSAKETLQGQQEESDTLGDIKTYMIEVFDSKFDRVVHAVEDLRDKVVDGKVEVSLSGVDVADILF